MKDSNTKAINESTQTLTAGSEYTISPFAFAIIESNKIVKNGKLTVRTTNGVMNQSIASKIRLYFKDSDNNYHLIDAAEYKVVNGFKLLIYDVSSALFLKQYLLGSIILKNESQNSLTFYIGSSLKVSFNYLTDSFNNQDNQLSLSASDYFLNFDHLSQDLVIKRTIYNNLLPYEVSLVYSSRRKDYSFLSFPKGWKLNLTDYLLINCDLNQNITSFIYVDNNNLDHIFVPLTGSSNLYYSNDGSALLLEIKETNSVITYEIFNELSSARKVFDSEGHLTSFITSNNRTFNLSYTSYSVSITDDNGNVILVDFTSTGMVAVYLNDSYVYELYYDNNNHLISVEYDVYSEHIYYDNDDLEVIDSFDDHSLEVTYSSYRISEIASMFDGNTLTKCNLAYDYLKTTITNERGVTSFISYTPNFDIYQKGEVVNNDDKLFFLISKRRVQGDFSVNTSTKIGRDYGASICPYYLNTSSDTEEYYEFQSFSYLNMSYGSNLTNGEQYYVVVSITKNQNVSYNNNRKVWVELGARGYQTSYIETIDSESFKYHTKKETIAFPFIADLNQTDNFFFIRVYAKGFGSVGGISIDNVYILKLNGDIIDYYANNISVDGYYMSLSNNSSVFDGQLWREIQSSFNTYEGLDVDYTYSDLIRNYLNIEKGTHFFWSNNLHNLTYLETMPSSTVFGKKALLKQYVESGEVKDIYSFSYLAHIIENNVSLYKLVTIKQIDNNSYKDTSIYNDDFLLIKEEKSNGDYTNYFYDLNNNLIKTESGNVNGSGIFRKEYGYDVKRRLISLSELLSTDIVTTQNQYLSNYNLQTKTIDPLNNEETYTYSSYYLYLSRVSRGNSFSEYVYGGYDSYCLYDGSNYNVIKGDYDTIEDVYVQTDEYDYFDNLVSINTVFSAYDKHTIINDGFIRKQYDIYKRFIQVNDSSTNALLTCLYYFEEKPSDLDNASSFPTAIQNCAAKLYLVKENSQKTYYDYNDEGKLSEIKVKILSNDEIYKQNYLYDDFDRVKITTYTFGISSYTRSLTYQNPNSNLITEVSYTAISESITYDSYSRISVLNYSPTSIPLATYKIEFVYYSKDVVENSESIKLESPLIKRMDYYAIPSSSGFFVVNPSYIYSSHISYDNNGNIVSIKKGTKTQIDSSTGVTYEYDSNNRLTKENNYDLNETIKYVLNNQGNITSVVHCTLNTDTVISSTSLTYHNYYKDLLIYYGNNRIYYDSQFNPTRCGSTYYSWGYGRLLTSITNSQTSLNASFTYNYQGLRTSKIVNGVTHTYYLEGKTIIREVVSDSSSSNILDYYYGVNGIIGFSLGINNYRYEKNILGDIIAIYQGRTLLARYIYDAYGNHIIVDSSGNQITNQNHVAHINPFRYRGYYYDRETNLYYCNTRYYNPEWRRWLSKDDVSYFDHQTIGGLSLFAYCLSNPIMYRDEDGTIALSSFLVGLGVSAVIGAIVGAVSYTISECINYALFNKWSWSWGQFFGCLIGGAVGGMLTFAFQPSSLVFISTLTDALSTAIGMTFQNEFEGSNYNNLQILSSSLSSAFISFIMSCLGGTIHIHGLNSGRNSYQAITKQILKKLYNGTIFRISYNTFSKMLVYSLTENLLNSFASGFLGDIDLISIVFLGT